MIEIERQFQLDTASRETLIAHADFVHKKVLKDIYYDTPDFAFARQDLWLRKRNDIFELKAPALGGHEEAEQYLEINDTELILQYMHLDLRGDFANSLAQQNLQPYCVCTIQRDEYLFDGITLDFDETTFVDGFTYSLGEAELLVQHKEEAQEAAQKLQAFMERFHLQKAEDKLVAYFRMRRAKDFDMLQKAGIL